MSKNKKQTQQAAQNNQAIAQTQALVAAAQDAANRGDYTAAQAIASQAAASMSGITSSGAQAAVNAALQAAQANISNPQQNVQSGGNAGYQAVQEVIQANPPRGVSGTAQAAQEANRNIGNAQGLTAAAQVAANTGSQLTENLKKQAESAISKVTNLRAQSAIQEALNRVVVPKQSTDQKIQPDDDPGDRRIPTTDQLSPSNLRPPAPTPPIQQRQNIVKSPNKDVINFQREEYSASSIARLLFEQVGSIELINIARRDTIEGQNPYYNLISNLSSIKKNFNPAALISRQRVNETVFDNFTIDLNSKIPDQEYLDTYNLESFYYIASNGDLVIELDNLADDERIELEIAESGTISLVDET